MRCNWPPEGPDGYPSHQWHKPRIPAQGAGLSYFLNRKDITWHTFKSHLAAAGLHRPFLLAGGFLASDPERAERIVGVAFGLAAMVALPIGFATLPALAVPVLFGAMGFVSGMAGPSRDLLVKRSAPDNASGPVYGVVYSGLDIGQALAPLVIGTLMDRGAFSSVWLALALLQGVLIVSAFNVRRVRRTVLAPV